MTALNRIEMNGSRFAWHVYGYLTGDLAPAITGLYRPPVGLGASREPEGAGVSWSSLGIVSLERADEFSRGVSEMRELVADARDLLGVDRFAIEATYEAGPRPKICVVVSCGYLRAEFRAGLLGDHVEVVRHGDSVEIPLGEDLDAEIAPGFTPTTEGFASLWYKWARDRVRTHLAMLSTEQVRKLAETGSADWTKEI